MALETRKFFEDQKRGAWLLAKEPATGHLFVRHEAGRVSHIELSAFLVPANQKPEHQALRDLISTLVSASQGGVSPSTHSD